MACATPASSFVKVTYLHKSLMSSLALPMATLTDELKHFKVISSITQSHDLIWSNSSFSAKCLSPLAFVAPVA